MDDRRWVDTPDRWAALADALLRSEEAGIDSETYDQPDKTSPQWRTRIHCWSIATLGSKTSPRGYRLASGLALPRAALDFPPLVDALKSITLWAHNAPHDEHSFRNEGIELVIQDTLQWARVAVPGKGDYALKSKGMKVGLEQWALGKPIRAGFKEMVSYRKTEVVNRERRVKRCMCGREGCRKQQTSTWWDTETQTERPHLRLQTILVTPVERTIDAKYAVTDFTPYHPRWKEWLDYVVVDSVSGIETVDWLRHLREPVFQYPWKANEEIRRSTIPALR